MTNAVILPPTAASFQRVAGLLVIQRTVRAALRCCERVFVLAGEHAGPLNELLEAEGRADAVEVAKTVSVAEGVLVLIPSDCVLTAGTLERVKAATLDGRPLLFGTAGGARMSLCRPGMLAGIDLGTLAASGAEALWTTLQARGAQAVPLGGEICLPVSDERTAVAAEAALCARLRATAAASDGPLAHWIDRRISLRISRWLVRHTWLRPNHITIVGTCVGLLAAGLLAVGSYGTGVAGTLLFLCATIIDGCDGEVAQLTFRESAFGDKFDVITDNIVHAAIFIGLALGLHHRDPTGHSLVFLGVLLGGFACGVIVSYVFLVLRPDFARSGSSPVSWKGKVRRWSLGAFKAAMNRDFAYLLVLFAIFDHLDWFLWGTAFGTYLFAVLLVGIYRWPKGG